MSADSAPATTPTPDSDPWQKSQARVATHMNEDHESSLLAYVHHFGALPSATGAQMLSFDAEGIEMVATMLDGSEKPLRILYSNGGLTSPRQIKSKAVAMHKEAFAALGFRYRLEHGYYQFVAAMIFAGVVVAPRPKVRGKV